MQSKKRHSQSNESDSVKSDSGKNTVHFLFLNKQLNKYITKTWYIVLNHSVGLDPIFNIFLGISGRGMLGREHLVFSDSESQLYHFSVEGDNVRDGIKIPPEVWLTLLYYISKIKEKCCQNFEHFMNIIKLVWARLIFWKKLQVLLIIHKKKQQTKKH
jgi:hypothetical protein